MEKKEPKLLTQYFARGINRRIVIEAYRNTEGTISFVVHTKRLADRKNRHILETTTVYGVETMILLHDLFVDMLSRPKLKKEMNPETGFAKWVTSVYEPN